MHGADEARAGDRNAERAIGTNLQTTYVRTVKQKNTLCSGLSSTCPSRSYALLWCDGHQAEAVIHAVIDRPRRRAPAADPRGSGRHAGRPSPGRPVSPARPSPSESTLCSRTACSTRRVTAPPPAAGPRPCWPSTTRPASCSPRISARRTPGSRSATWPARRWPRRNVDMDIAAGPEPVLGLGRRAVRRAARARPAERPTTCTAIGVGVPGPVDVRERAAGQSADHARVGRVLDPGLVRRPLRGAPVLVDNDVNIMALGEHRPHWRDDEHLLLRQGRHRHRLRHRRERSHPSRRRGRCRRHRPHPRDRPQGHRLPLWQHRLPGGRRRGPALARRLAEAGEEATGSRDVVRLVPEWSRGRHQDGAGRRADAGRGVGGSRQLLQPGA